MNNPKLISSLDAEHQYLMTLFLESYSHSKHSDLDYKRLTRLINQKHRCLNQFLDIADLSIWPKEAIDRLKTQKLKLKQRALLQLSILIEIKDHLKDFDFLVLKGLALSEVLYGDFTYRSSTDIDLLIPPEQEQEIIQKLVEQGFEKAYDYEHHYVIKRYNTSIELHRKLTAVFNTQVLEQQMWAKSYEISIEGYAFKVPDHQSMYLYMLINGSIHMWSRLSWVVDFINYRKKFKTLSKDHEFVHLEQLFDSIFSEGQVETKHQQLILQALTEPDKTGLSSQLKKAKFFAEISNYSKVKSYYKSLLRLVKRV